MAFLSTVLNSVVFYYSWFRKPNFCGSSDIVVNQCQTNYQISVRGGGMRRSQNLEIGFSVKKKTLHTAFRSVQFLASFVSFYF